MKKKIIYSTLIILFSLGLYFDYQFDENNVPLFDLLGVILLFGWSVSVLLFTYQFKFIQDMLCQELDPNDESF